MFGFSIQKLVLLAVIIGAVWYGFKLAGRIDPTKKGGSKGRSKVRKPGWWPGGGGDGGSGSGAGRTEAVEAEDMVQCPTCQAYVPARGAKACERPGCPYG